MTVPCFALTIPPIEALGPVDSTMSEAGRRAGRGLFGPVWLLADEQTAGRGRSGRAWQSPRGNLAATLLMPFDRPPAEAAQMSFVACLAVADFLDGATGAPARITLKWPNDALLDGRKIAGVLLESGAGWLSVGIGLNLASAPQDVRWPAISLAEAVGREAPTPAAALSALAESFAHREAAFREEGFAPIRRAWLARAAHIGDPIEARLPRETLAGSFEGIAEDGTLLIETAGGLRRIAAADIHFPA